MTKIKAMMTKVILGAMTVTTLLATSAGASAATVTTTNTAAPAVRTTVQLDSRPAAPIHPMKIHLKRVTTKRIASQVQTVVDASALNLDQKHSDDQLK
ncbi:hypothetical protein [Levilactobacillus parabrevis]|nr:hypothetical protein [Levilactobacillus parabrevis]MCT4487315.1 hypothetical protein [Levilactobacillus parabrevis]MCT4490077.1 hypothetical protein [Levilactobacillus parabrevis]